MSVFSQPIGTASTSASPIVIPPDAKPFDGGFTLDPAALPAILDFTAATDPIQAANFSVSNPHPDLYLIVKINAPGHDLDGCCVAVKCGQVDTFPFADSIITSLELSYAEPPAPGAQWDPKTLTAAVPPEAVGDPELAVCVTAMGTAFTK